MPQQHEEPTIISKKLCINMSCCFVMRMSMLMFICDIYIYTYTTVTVLCYQGDLAIMAPKPFGVFCSWEASPFQDGL